MATRLDCYQIEHHCHHHDVVDIVTLDFESRTRSRGKTCSRAGEEVAWFFERGEYLRQGDCLISEEGRHILVTAAPEPVSKVVSTDPHLITRVAYHLGNRHVPLQVSRDCLLYQPDYVLDDMVRQLGADVSLETLPFQPEDGAYRSAGGHHHEH